MSLDEHTVTPETAGGITGALHAAKAGDTVIVAEGVYGRIWYDRDPPEGKPITLRAAKKKKWKAVIYGNGAPCIYGKGVSNLIIDGFQLVGGTEGVRLRDANNVTIRNCWIHHATRWGGIAGSGNSNVTIEDNLLGYNGSNPQFHHGIYIVGRDLTARRNIVRHSSGRGLNIQPTGGMNVIEQNVAFGHEVHRGLFVLASGDAVVLVRNNTVQRNAQAPMIDAKDQSVALVANNLLRTDWENRTGPEARIIQLAEDVITTSGFRNGARGNFLIREDTPARREGPPGPLQAARDFWQRPMATNDAGAFGYDPALPETLGYYQYPYPYSPGSGDPLHDQPDFWELLKAES